MSTALDLKQGDTFTLTDGPSSAWRVESVRPGALDDTRLVLQVEFPSTRFRQTLILHHTERVTIREVA